jgi:futalosine hydrolase
VSLPHALILVAVQKEGDGIIGEMSRVGWSTLGGRRMCSGYLGKVPVCLLITGPGQVNCVQAFTAAVEHGKPALVIQAGCAGGFSQAGMRVGDLGVATAEIDAHLGIEAQETDAPLAPLPFPVGCYGGEAVSNRYPTDPLLAQRAREILEAEVLGRDEAVICGPFLTVSTITATDRRARWYFEAHRVCMESMEGAGAAHVALHYDLPFIEVRAASNLVGRRDRAAWDLPLAVKRCARATLALLREGMPTCQAP